MGTTHDQLSWQNRVGALSGAAYVLLILVGNQIATGGAQDAHPTGTKDLATLANQVTSGTARTGQAMEIIGMVAFAFFLAWFVHLLRRMGGAAAWLSTTALVGGVTTLAVKIASVLPVIAATVDRNQISATSARVLVDQNNAGFVITFLTFGIFMVGAGLAVLGSGVMGRVAGWSAVVIGALGIIETAVAVSLDVNPMPFLLGLVWILAVSVRLAWKGPRPRVSKSTERGLAPAAI
jgi:hypothetical protein